MLSLASLGVNDVAAFPFFEAPPLADPGRDRPARASGAIDEPGAITSIGRALLALPLHPLGKVVLARARYAGLERDGALLAAVLAEREVRAALRTRFGERERAASESGSSDAMERLEAIARARSRTASPDPLSRATGSIPAPRIPWFASAIGIRGAVGPARLAAKGDETQGIEATLLRAILAGYPDCVGKRRRRTATRLSSAAGGSARLAESSVVREAELVVCVEAEEKAGKVLCRIASAIEPEWLLELFPDCVKDVREVRFDPEKERIELITRAHVRRDCD